MAAAIPVLFFVLLEGGLRLLDYGGNLDLFISAPGAYSDYFLCNPKVGRRYFFMQNTVPNPPNDLFLKVKPSNGYRIFALGGSTTAGYPYGNNIMFPRILQSRLADIFPDKQIEVVNTAMTAVNSFTMLDYMDEILAMQPDAILIYGGHNEFYGALGAASNESLGRFRGFVKLYLKLQRAKTFLLMRDLIGGIKKLVSRTFFKGDISHPSATLMERIVGEQTIALGSTLYEIGKRQFTYNLRDIVQTAQAAGVSVILSELVSNVRDVSPFVSIATDSLPAAGAVFEQAQQLEQKERYEEARRAYLRAKDLDALRFRASEEFNAIIRETGAEHGVPVVPMKQRFEKTSPNGLVGNNLMLEHLHPNLEGYFLMADAFLQVMRTEGMIAGAWETNRIQPAEDHRENYGFTELDRAYSDIRIKILKGSWPFQPKALPNRALLNYQPQAKIDSLAFKAWKDDEFGLEHAHVELAEFYERKGMFLQAFDEYNALTCLTPLNDSPYLHAADMLIKARQLGRALPYLHDALALEENAFSNKWIGQIYLDGGRTAEALPFLEAAARMNPKDAQTIYNLSGAHALSGHYEDAKKSLDKLYTLNPNFPGADDLKRQLDKL